MADEQKPAPTSGLSLMQQQYDWQIEAQRREIEDAARPAMCRMIRMFEEWDREYHATRS